MKTELKCTAIVVGYNEEFYLDSCFGGLDWCTEIIYFDLYSTDRSVEIASRYTNNIHVVDRLPRVELIHEKYCQNIESDLLLITDPDEVINSALKKELAREIKTFDISLFSELRVNMYYFFKGKKLKGTYWGGVYSARLIFNKSILKFTGKVHNGNELDWSNVKIVDWDKNSFVEHHWGTSWTQLFEKHRRYLVGEGISLKSQGFDYNFISHIKYTIKAFFYSFFIRKGYNDGWLGFLLSLFWSWYNYRRWEELRKYKV